MFSVVDIDYGVFDTIKMLTGVELMILITLFMGLMPIFHRIRSLETKIIEIQYSLSKVLADIENLNHAYNYKVIKSSVDIIADALIDVTDFLHKEHDFKVKESNRIKYLDYDP